MRRLLAALLVTFFASLPLALSAQDDGVPAEWSIVSNRAAAVLQSGQASDEALGALRAELVDWRARFQALRGTNSGRIATVQSSLDALGDPPAEGESEPAEVADRRAELTADLEVLQAPVRSAEVAFNSADGLIAETDELIANRAAEALFRQEAAPLNPVTWWPAVTSAGAWFVALADQTVAPFATASSRAYVQSQGVQIGLLFAVALVLLFRSGTWLNRLRDRLAVHEATSPIARLGLLGTSLGRLALPLIGLVAAARIPQLIGAEGPIVGVALDAIPVMGAAILIARWLSMQAFPLRPDTPILFPVAEDNRAEGRFHAVLIGVLFAMAIGVEAMAEGDPASDDYRGVIHFAIAVMTGLSLLRLGQFFLREGLSARDDGDGGFWAQLMRLTGRILMVVGAVSPLMIGAGYVNLGLAIMWPTVMSLSLIVVIGVVQSAVFDVYAAVTRRAETARDALAPTLVGFALAVAAMPLFALIWGVREQTLLEWWQGFLDGYAIGGTRLSPTSFLTFAVVFALGYLLTRLVKGVLRTNVLPKTKLDTGGTNAILSGTSYVGITLAALLAITTAGIDLSGLAIVAGALSVGVGFGLQTIVQNFVSGIILLIERPIKIGDWVAVGGIEGFVRQISVRSTRIETFDRQDVIVPNADLISGVVTNYTLGNATGRVLVPVGVAYGTDTRRVEAILREITEAHPMVVLNPPPTITFEGFGADSQDFLIRAVLRDVLWKVIVKSEINHGIAERFREEGIEIPFAQRDVWLRNPEVLQPQSPEGQPDAKDLPETT
ncbi:DUF3772 domain-containing protein [Jannaschia sp. 2305UL9-9]|uniref:DUF3772 domain-containing protein n=1 Tax=Jannaschia sp. 2305UL9-9 TaxID=3121638 RepID=UPI0035294D6C